MPTVYNSCELCGESLKGHLNLMYKGDYHSNTSVKLKNGYYCKGTCEQKAREKLYIQYDNKTEIYYSHIFIFYLFLYFILIEFDIKILYTIPPYYYNYYNNMKVYFG